MGLPGAMSSDTDIREPGVAELVPPRLSLLRADQEAHGSKVSEAGDRCSVGVGAP
jgi:hypothetical protein